MAINVTVYSNGNSSSKTINVDFACELLSSSYAPLDNQIKYFFKISTTAKDTSNATYFPAKVLKGLGGANLALNGTKQAVSNTAADYSTITELIEDHIYDMVTGHEANKNNSGVSYRPPMKFP